MKRILKLAQYQLSQYKIAMLIYYPILILFAAFSDVPGSGNATASSVITIFVLGLNSFKSSFKFSQANNITRRTFFFGTIISLLALASFMALADAILDKFFKHVSLDLYGQIYPPSFGTQVLWSALLLGLLASLGWLITTLYYRVNAKGKILVSLSPILIYWLLSLVENLTDGRFGDVTGRFVLWALGAGGAVLNPFAAILSFFVMSLILWFFNYLLIYRAPVKA